MLYDNDHMLRVFLDSGFEVTRRLDGGMYHVALSLEPTALYEARSAIRSQAAATASMKSFFEPRSVVVVGANRARGKIGAEVLHNLLAGGFTGRIVAVHSSASSINTDPAIRLNATFSPVTSVEGRVAFSTQSGGLGIAILDYVRQLNLGISTFVSVGNKADVSGNDLLQYWTDDPRTDVILLYLESFGNPRRFGQIARHVAQKKPIVAVKAGRSRAGARAASSHTGALAASDAVVDALFQQAGVIRTETLEELFDVAAVLAHQPLPAGPRVAVLSNAGGPAILAADACEAQGLELSALSDASWWSTP